MSWMLSRRVFLFMTAGPFLKELFLTSPSQNYSSATPRKTTKNNPPKKVAY